MQYGKEERMESMKGGLVRLRALMDDLTPSERKIGAYILDHPQETVQSSVAQLSERSGAARQLLFVSANRSG